MDVYLVLLGVPVLIGSLIVARALLNPDGLSIDDLLTRSDLTWPRGVQEEEPVRWRYRAAHPSKAPGSGTAG